MSTTTTQAKVVASMELTPKSRLSITRARAKAPPHAQDETDRSQAEPLAHKQPKKNQETHIHELARGKVKRRLHLCIEPPEPDVLDDSYDLEGSRKILGGIVMLEYLAHRVFIEEVPPGKRVVNPNRKIFEARKRETAALGTGEKLVLGHPLAATIGDSARCMQNLEKVLFTGPKTSDTVTFICD